LRLKAGEAPIQGQEYWVSPDNWIEHLDPLLARLENRGPSKAAPGSRPLWMRLHDANILVFGDVVPVKQFLMVKGKFSPPPCAPPRASTDTGDSQPGGRRFPGPGGDPNAGSGDGTPAIVSASYMTIKPQLKAMMDWLESRPPVVFSGAEEVELTADSV